MASRRVGNQPVGTAQALLPPHSGGEKETVALTEGMGGTFWRAEAADKGGPCVIGKSLSASAFLASNSVRPRRKKSTRNSRRTCKNRTKYFVKKDCPKKKRFIEPLSKLRVDF